MELTNVVLGVTCLSGALIILALVRSKKSSTSRERSVSTSSAFLLHGTYPPASNVPFCTIEGLLLMDEVPTRNELMDHAEKHLVNKFVRFRTVPVIQGRGVVMMDLGIRMENHVTYREVSSEEEIHKVCNERLGISLPRDRPLWELQILKNVGQGRSAVLGMFDHGIADGISSIAIFNSLFTDADGKSPGMTLEFGRSVKKSSGNLVIKIVKTAWTTLTAFLKVMLLASPFAPSDAYSVISGPATRKDMKWSTRHVFWSKPIALETFKPLRQKLGVTVNDVLTCVLTGAFRRYLEYKKDPILENANSRIRLLSPVAMPRPYDAEKPLRNNFAMLSSPLLVHQPDQTTRLHQIHHFFEKLKKSPEAFFTLLVAKFGMTCMPLIMLQNTCRDLFCKHSFLWSNVPGPTKPIYLAGKKVLEFKPAVPTIQNQATAFSYNGAVTISFVVEEAIMKDSNVFNRCIDEELEAMKRL